MKLRCSFCRELKPKNEIRKTYDEKDLVCKYLDECENFKDDN